MWRTVTKSSLYIRVMYAPSSYRYGATVVLVLAVVGLVVSGGYNGVGMFLSKTEQRMDTLQHQCRENAVLRRECIKLKEAIHDLGNELASYTHSFGTDDCMLDLFSRAHRAGIALENCNVSRETEKGWYTNKRVQLGFSGPYSQVISFFKALQKDGNLARCNEMTVTRLSTDLFKINCVIKMKVISAEKTLQLRIS